MHQDAIRFFMPLQFKRLCTYAMPADWNKGKQPMLPSHSFVNPKAHAGPSTSRSIVSILTSHSVTSTQSSIAGSRGVSRALKGGAAGFASGDFPNKKFGKIEMTKGNFPSRD